MNDIYTVLLQPVNILMTRRIFSMGQPSIHDPNDFITMTDDITGIVDSVFGDMSPVSWDKFTRYI